MITFYSADGPGIPLDDSAACPQLTRDAIWIDLHNPTPEEERVLEAALGIDVPTRAEMQEIELSSRLYKEKDALFMTGTVLLKADTTQPESSVVTFILDSQHLVTVRYADAVPFQAFRIEREKNLKNYQSGYSVFAGLIDAIIDRIADILEGVGTHLDQVSLEVFDASGMNAIATGPAKVPVARLGAKPLQRDYSITLRQIGRISDLISRTRESLVSFGRIISYVREVHMDSAPAHDAVAHLKTVAADLGSLSDHATFLSGKVSFLLDATLGMINNQQNIIIKIISVAAVVFLPPTLVAGIYGMNFHVLPELHWTLGYPFALFLMAISAVLPYFYFKRKGWL
ncbi:MAG TPA: magnesium transporter CorA family protein [Chthoniobacterales bacterium]|nr:magnesium transporter CorA family protein [Chthoniobacterales bacterium]